MKVIIIAMTSLAFCGCENRIDAPRIQHIQWKKASDWSATIGDGTIKDVEFGFSDDGSMHWRVAP
jgi:hypothetical protein